MTQNILSDLLTDLDNDQDVGNINLEKISPDPDQPRKNFLDSSIDELAASINEHGILQPILVYPKGEAYIIIAGERRYRACKKLGLTSIPCRIMHYKTEMNKMEVSLIENIQRENLNAIDLAQSFQELMQKFNLTQEDIAQKISKSRSFVANIVRLLNLPTKIQETIRSGKISFGHAKALMGSDDPERFLDDIVSSNISVRELEKKVKKENRLKKEVVIDQGNEDLEYIRHTLEKKLNLKTSIKLDQSGGGKIICYFDGFEKLDRLLQVLN